ncbi:hypothetical protein EK758_07795, partial [Listeria monocytogenes]|nr:hypothetical protein [Listeria monocytogenes]
NINAKNAPIDMYVFLLKFNPKLPRLFCNAESFLKSPFLNFFLKRKQQTIKTAIHKTNNKTYALVIV